MRLWTVPVAGERSSELVAAVAGPVVGQDPPHRDAGSVKERRGAGPEPGAGAGPLIAKALDVGQAGVVVDGGVEIVVADPTPASGATTSAVDAVAAAGGDTAQLLGVDMDQVAGVGMLVAADHPAGGAVQPVESVLLVADQNPVDGPGVQPEPSADAGRAEPQRTQVQDLAFECDREAAWVGVRGAGPVDEPGRVVGLVAGPPAIGRGARATHLVGDVGDRPAGAGGDALAQQQPARRGSAWR